MVANFHKEEKFFMSAFAGDPSTLECSEIENKLEQLAKEWRESPHLSSDLHHGVRYSGLCQAWKSRCGAEAYIAATPERPTDYRLHATRNK
jgi:hypothetical protein